MRAVVPNPGQLTMRKLPPDSAMRPAIFCRPMDRCPSAVFCFILLREKPPPLSVIWMRQPFGVLSVTMRMRPPALRLLLSA